MQNKLDIREGLLFIYFLGAVCWLFDQNQVPFYYSTSEYLELQYTQTNKVHEEWELPAYLEPAQEVKLRGLTQWSEPFYALWHSSFPL